MIIGADNKIVDAYEVNFETKNGVKGKVTVPVKEFTKETVKQLISDLAGELEATLQLGAE
jgi:hypothetical protein